MYRWLKRDDREEGGGMMVRVIPGAKSISNVYKLDRYMHVYAFDIPMMPNASPCILSIFYKCKRTGLNLFVYMNYRQVHSTQEYI